MVSKQEILNRIRNDWRQTSQVDFCLEVANYILGLHSSTNHLTYGSFRKIENTANRCNEEELQGILKYFCGERAHLLEIGFELIENDEYIEITNSEIREAKKTGKLLHPDTGELIGNFEEQIFIYFKPSKLSQDLAS